MSSPSASRRALLAAVAAQAWPDRVTAQTAERWPSRPIRVIVPNPPGGPGDTVFRLLAPVVGATLGQPLTMDHRPGAGNTIGTALTARSAPDGYTLGIGNIASLAVGPAVYPAVGYDPVRDLTAIALLLEIPLTVVVSDASPFRSLPELLGAARQRPGGLALGTPGNGTASHLLVEGLRRATGAELLHTPYRGGIAALTELLAGRIDAAIPSLAETSGQDRIRVLAHGAPFRLAHLPDVPTFAEAGMPDLIASVWWCLVGPAGLPDAVMLRLRREVAAALHQPDVAGRLRDLGALPVRDMSGAELARFVENEAVRWGGMARAARIRPD